MTKKKQLIKRRKQLSTIFLQHMASHELEARFGQDDKLACYDTEEIYVLTEEEIKPYLKFLPKKEADLILMYYVIGKDQKEIASILRLTQGGVSHRIKRAKDRLSYIMKRPKLDERIFRKDLKDHFEKIDIDILWGLFMTTCQSQVAVDMGLTQSKVRHGFMKSLEKLESIQDISKNFKTYYEALKTISKNFNILREIKLPKWSEKNLPYLLDESDV